MLNRSQVNAAALIFLGTCALAARAQDSQTLERVEITGSSIKRIDAETALPVQIITREQIQKTGALNAEQLIQTIPSISSSGALTASSASGATTGGISAISLHGLTSIRTLVLLNGRRIAPYGIGFTGDSVSVDVNSIPLAAVERVEVLKDGASAIYGSDAIAGVVNFITRQETHGIELTGEGGTTTRGGAASYRATGVFGIGDLSKDRYNASIVLSYQRENSLFGRDRDFANTGINVTNGNDSTSGNTFPANIAAANGTIGSRNPTASTGCVAPYSTLDPNFAQNRCRFDPAPLVTLVPATDRYSAFANAKFALTPDIQLYSEASYNENKIHTIIQPVPLSDQFALPPNNPLYNQAPYNGFATILLKSSSQYYPTTYVQGLTGGPTPDLLIRYRCAACGNRDITDTSKSPRFVFGSKGTLFGFDYDANYVYSQTKVTETVNGGYPAYSKILPILNSGNFNPFGDSSAAIDQAIQASGYTGDAYSTNFRLQTLAAKVSRELFVLPIPGNVNPMAIAVGVEGRQEKYAFTASPTIQTGDISGYGGNFLDTNKTRYIKAVFSELNVPIVKQLEANLAARYDYYEGVGSSITPKASLRYQPSQQLLFRGSYGKGFRAPSIQDEFLPNTTGVTPSGLSDPLRCPTTNDTTHDCNTQFNVLFGGNPNLHPETSHTWTLGTVIQPTPNFSVGIDYWQVRLDNTIVNGVDAQTILSDPVKYAYLITRAPRTASDIAAGIPGQITQISQTNLNLGTTKVAGYDVDIKWTVPTQTIGRFVTEINGTLFQQLDTQNTDGSYSGGLDQTNPATGGVTPRVKAYTTVNWQYGPYDVTIANNYQKHYNDITSSITGANRVVASYITWDLQGSYQVWKNLKVTLGARNILDKAPPYSNAGGITGFQSGYDQQYGDPRGRYVYGRVGYTFQ